MAKSGEVRSRRAYFDTRHGQLHVRTAFPGTGGFDEHTTLFCIHPAGPSQTSRFFAAFLPLMAADRSLYAPDRPGHGESDGTAASPQAHAEAMADLATDLRLRKIDLLGVEDGAGVALMLARAQPDRVRRVVIAAANPQGLGASATQPCLTLRLGAGGAAEFPLDAFSSDPAGLARAVSAFLNLR